MLITTLDEENSVMKNNELKKDFGGWIIAVIAVIIFIGAVIMENIHWLA